MFTDALTMLKSMIGTDAQFRTGQLEAITQIVEKRSKALLVQRTGWGKSIVYFIATRMLRERGSGPALLISPLLSLMRNQVEMAQKAGIVQCARLDSSNKEEWEAISERIIRNEIDVLLISPERLANEKFRQNILPSLSGGIGLFIIDEAHCISDWGHDFRPDYRRIVRILNLLTQNVPVLGTTATANNRVIADIQEQVGKDVVILRGKLARKSLYLQNIIMKNQAERLAWLSEVIPGLEGSGIVYCLTQRDTERVTGFLRQNNINAKAYHAGLRESRENLEDDLINNRVKVLVATVALGMGFDKPDIGFVIHYQKPGSVIAYYQQVGRAGRALEKAYGVLLSGEEDDQIIDYFISTAFPKVDNIKQIIGILENSDEGLTQGQIQKSVNASYKQIEKALKHLLIDGFISYEKPLYSRTLKQWTHDTERIEKVTQQRYHELKKMNEYMNHSGCLMEFLCKELDDIDAHPCGNCAGCIGALLPEKPSDDSIHRAIKYLKGDYYTFEPKKMWPAGIVVPAMRKKINPSHLHNKGCSLCYYGDSGWGMEVAKCKYKLKEYSEKLVDASVELILSNWRPDPAPQWVTAIPSNRSGDLVPDFARRIAAKLNIPFKMVIAKTSETKEQKEMQNSYKQCRNVLNCFEICSTLLPGPVLLIDDIVDSGWTLTVIGTILRDAGSEEVFPFTLAAAPTKGNY